MIMEKIILDAKLTPERNEEFKEFKTNKLKRTDTLLDDLHLQIKYFKGVDILTYYTPSDPTKDKEKWKMHTEP